MSEDCGGKTSTGRGAKELKEVVDEDRRANVRSGSNEPSPGADEPVISGTNKDMPDIINDEPQSISKSPQKRSKHRVHEEAEEDNEDDDDDEPVRKRMKRNGRREKKQPLSGAESQELQDQTPKNQNPAFQAENKKSKPKMSSIRLKSPTKSKNVISETKKSSKQIHDPSENNSAPADNDLGDDDHPHGMDVESEDEQNDLEEAGGQKATAGEKIQSTLKTSSKDPYPDWKPGEPVPYAALCTTFSLIEMTTKRLIIMAHCSLLLRQILRLTPEDLLSTIQLMINKLAADYAGIELGIGESLIMKAIGESTGRSLQVIKADQAEIGDLGLVAAKSRSNQPTMFKPKPLTVRGVLDGLMGIATTSGDGSQARKIAGIKKLLSAADTVHAGKGSKGIDITKDKGGASESKFIIRFLEGKLRLGLAEKTVLVSIAHAMVSHEVEKRSNKPASSEKLAEGELILKTVYRYVNNISRPLSVLTLL